MTYEPLHVSSEHLGIAFQCDLFQSRTLSDLGYHCIYFLDLLRSPNLHQTTFLGFVRSGLLTYDPMIRTGSPRAIPATQPSVKPIATSTNEHINEAMNQFPCS